MYAIPERDYFASYVIQFLSSEFHSPSQSPKRTALLNFAELLGLNTAIWGIHPTT